MRISSIMALFGIVLLVGTVGSIDLDRISCLQACTMFALSFILILPAVVRSLYES